MLNPNIAYKRLIEEGVKGFDDPQASGPALRWYFNDEGYLAACFWRSDTPIIYKNFKRPTFGESLTFSTCYALAGELHKGQLYGEEPYINHPVRVMERVAAVTSKNDLLCAALLHDTIEDCGIDHAELTSKVGTQIAALVLQLTRNKKDETYAYYILRLTHTGEGRFLKLCDLAENLEQCEKNLEIIRDRTGHPTEEYKRYATLYARYETAIKVLTRINPDFGGKDITA